MSSLSIALAVLYLWPPRDAAPALAAPAFASSLAGRPPGTVVVSCLWIVLFGIESPLLMLSDRPCRDLTPWVNAPEDSGNAASTGLIRCKKESSWFSSACR